MAKIVTRAALLEMAQKCARTSEKQHGTPILDDAAEMLEQASFRVAELEDRLERWIEFGKVIEQKMPIRMDPHK